VLHIKTIKK